MAMAPQMTWRSAWTCPHRAATRKRATTRTPRAWARPLEHPRAHPWAALPVAALHGRRSFPASALLRFPAAKRGLRPRKGRRGPESGRQGTEPPQCPAGGRPRSARPRSLMGRLCAGVPAAMARSLPPACGRRLRSSRRCSKPAQMTRRPRKPRDRWRSDCAAWQQTCAAGAWARSRRNRHRGSCALSSPSWTAGWILRAFCCWHIVPWTSCEWAPCCRKSVARAWRPRTSTSQGCCSS
mmetsp:Transcript_142858/g.397964  ORF Transcript_142858/g.397964 Transcript_142858/m.397964 type:complete len:239 (-) Transcript_142858:1586-2302(-)